MLILELEIATSKINIDKEYKTTSALPYISSLV